MAEERVAVYAGTRNIYHDMAVSAKSLLFHNGADHVVFLIEDDDFTESLPDCITCMNVSNQSFFRHDGPNYNCHWTYMVMMRTALAKLFPKLSRVLVLDHDTIVRKPIDELWNINLGDKYYFALVEENFISNRTHPYYNFGVGIHNLALLRKYHMDDTIIDAVNNIHYTYCEQDAVNSICWQKIFPLPTRFNVMSFNQPHIPDNDVCIRHFAAGLRPLSRYDEYRFFDAMPWNDVLAHTVTSDVPMIGRTRYDIINYFVRERGFLSFLEIGTAAGETYRNVTTPVRISVDPDPASMATYRMTSDRFFNDFFFDPKKVFDVIFIDGLHKCTQAFQDLQHALKHISSNGVIIMHDCLPTSEAMQRPADHYPGGLWTGDVWKAFALARKALPYELYTIDTDFGCGIIDITLPKKSDTSSIPGDMNDMTYNDFISHPEWMNRKGGIIHD